MAFVRMMMMIREWCGELNRMELEFGTRSSEFKAARTACLFFVRYEKPVVVINNPHWEFDETADFRTNLISLLIPDKDNRSNYLLLDKSFKIKKSKEILDQILCIPKDDETTRVALALQSGDLRRLRLIAKFFKIHIEDIPRMFPWKSVPNHFEMIGILIEDCGVMPTILGRKWNKKDLLILTERYEIDSQKKNPVYYANLERYEREIVIPTKSELYGQFPNDLVSIIIGYWREQKHTIWRIFS